VRMYRHPTNAPSRAFMLEATDQPKPPAGTTQGQLPQTLGSMKRILIVNGILAVAIGYCVGLMAYAAWNHGRLVTGRVAVVVYFLLPASLALFFLRALWGRSALKNQLALALVSLGVALFLAELFVALYRHMSDPDVVRDRLCQQMDKEYDTRSRREVVLSFRAQGMDAVPVITAHHFYTGKKTLEIGGSPVIPLGGISNVRTVFCNECGTYLAYDSDEHGFHNPRGLYSVGAIEIAVLGDSFVQGACVPSNQNIAAYLRWQFPKTINLGGAGNGPLCMLGTLAEFAQPLRAKNVFWFYYEENDLADLEGEKASLLSRYLESSYSNGLLNLQAEIDAGLRSIIAEEIENAPPFQAPRLFKDALLLRGSRGLVNDSLGLENSPDYDLVLFEEVLRVARERAQAYGGRLFFVYLPTYARFLKPTSSILEKHRWLVRGAVENLGIPCIDICDVFSQHYDPLSLFPFRTPGHYTPEAYRMVAEAVLKCLENTK